MSEPRIPQKPVDKRTITSVLERLQEAGYRTVQISISDEGFRVTVAQKSITERRVT